MAWKIISSVIALLCYLGALVCAAAYVWVAWDFSGGSPMILLIGGLLLLAIGYFGFRRLFGPVRNRSSNA
jgi:hypothetical protein